MKPVMKGSIDLTVPSGLRCATTTSPPILWLLFHEPWRAMKIALRYEAGNICPVLEAHAERRRMRPELRNWFGELTAAVTPAVYRILNIAAGAIGETEIVFSGVENPVQLVLRLVLGKP